MDYLLQLLEPLQSWLFQALVLPLLFNTGFMAYADDAYSATGYFVLSISEIALVYALLRPLEAWRPVENWRERGAVRVDVLYTFLYRTGLLPLLFFIVLQPLLNPLDIWLRAESWLPPNLEELIPWLGQHALAAFFAYLVIVDFFEYWFHRLQHRFDWWWSLHAVHHSQRQLSFWADDRNHVLDGLIHALWLALLATAIGLPGNYFFFLLVVTRFVESLSHVNARIGFGWLGERLLVSPHYHRLHHGIGVGHEGSARGCNFATLFPAWDLLFGTANFQNRLPATGIRDQLKGRDYGRGFIRQQLLGLQRLLAALKPAGRPG
jgi:sterol desaturase/sphingolipid hydroxylase (fatty acid hydroxylase superfamily)